MLPLVAIATAVIPDLIKIIAGDRAGKIADTVAEAVTTATGTDDPQAAQRKIEQDPAIAALLRVKLAEIALQETRLQNEKEAAERTARLQAEEKQRQDALAVLRTQFENDQKLREQQFQQQQTELRSAIEQTAGARALQLDLIGTGDPIKWAPVGVSAIVTLLFAGAIVGLFAIDKQGPKGLYTDLINISIGALVAGFSTVISYWLGSSQGSRDKDMATRQMQATQAAQNSQQIEIVARQSKEIIRANDEARHHPTATEAASPVPVPARKGSNFDACLTLVLGAEGGFSNDPRDRGGATKYGITIGTLTDWRRSRSPDATVALDDVHALTVEEAKEIYRSRYWNVMRCDDLPGGVDLLVFDFGVNAGPARSARILQEILGVEQDGSIGPVTLNGLNTVTPDKIIRDFSARRLDFYRSLKDFAVFGAGWTNRTNSMLEAALRMVAR
jgi:Glycosyl hydrolase 108/Predicted Peptidoglycan domain